MNAFRHCAELSWETGYAEAPDAAPEIWIPATVPGAVQLDWARAHDWPPYYHADNFHACRWMEDVWWSYRATVPPDDPARPVRWLLLEGIDHAATIFLDDEEIARHVGMNAPCRIDLSKHTTAGRQLRVRLDPAPRSHDRVDAKSQANATTKPAVSYGWDWHPRLVPLGLWDEAYLEDRPARYLAAVELTTAVSEDLQHAHAHLAVTASMPGGIIRARLLSPDDAVVATAETAATARIDALALPLASPQLWMPHTHGIPHLYTVEVELRDERGAVVDTWTKTTGFRRVQLVMNEDAWETKSFPKSRGDAPITLEINGHRLFALGSNWVNPDIFPGTITAARYAEQLQLARQAHFNLLRCWGGAGVDKESFFTQCDQLGLMVWQEFPLSCNCYPNTNSYLEELDTVSQAIIRRLRPHPSVVMWSGGNELFNSWSGMNDQSHALRLLNRNCFDLDRTTPFIATSPLKGIGHGPYVFRHDNGEEGWQGFFHRPHTAYTEFGCPGPSPRETFDLFMPVDEQFPPREGTAWETHHGLGAWPEHPTSWLCTDVLAHYFGEATSLDTLIARGQWLQAEGYRHYFEEARRQKPKASMALNWCYNDCWPCAANNSLIAWPNLPKPAYRAVAEACRPVLASARCERFSGHSGDELGLQLFMLNDGPDEAAAVTVHVVLEHADLRAQIATWEAPATGFDRPAIGPQIKFALPPAAPSAILVVHLETPADPARTNRYELLLNPPGATHRSPPPP